MKFISVLLSFAVCSSASATAKSPYLIFVHGGAWISDRPEQYVKLADALRTQGYCVVNAKYTLAPQAKHPVQVRELNDAIVETTKLAAANCDPKHIFLIGHSAGAHMIASWNTAFTNSAVKGFIGVEGIYDLPLLLKTWPSYEADFVTTEFGKEREAASPSRIKPKSKAPWLLVQSKEDELVDAAQTKVFEKFLKEQKVSVESVETSGSHFDAIFQIEKSDSKIAKAVKAFVERVK